VRVVLIGNFVVWSNGSRAEVRGPPYYGALALLPLTEEVTLVSAANPRDVDAVLGELNGATVLIRPCRRTTRFERGTSRLVERGCRIPVDQVISSAVPYSTVVVDPAVGEVSESSMGDLYRSSRLLSINLGGFVRGFDRRGLAVRRWDWDRARLLLKDVDLAYARVEDVPPAGGSPRRALEILLGLGARCAAVVSCDGVYVGHRRGLYHSPTPLEGEGGDDVFLAVLSYALASTGSPAISLAYGVAAVELMRSRPSYPWYRAVDLENSARVFEMSVRGIEGSWR